MVAHRTRRFHLNHVLGILIGSVITIGLIGSLVLLIGGLALQKEKGMALLISDGELWLSNVLVFALWYWRLDGGAPNERGAHPEFGSRSFVFPQMQMEKAERSRFGITEG